MRVYIRDTQSDQKIEAIITKAAKKEMPLLKDNWHFSWRRLTYTEGAEFYKLTTSSSPEDIEGLLMLTLVNQEMLFMNNIEIAPHNFGSKGKYEYVAGCLLAFGCKKSVEVGRGDYLGYLSFDSKTELISLYQTKYGASLAMGKKMFFHPSVGKRLIAKYLSTNI